MTPLSPGDRHPIAEPGNLYFLGPSSYSVVSLGAFRVYALSGYSLLPGTPLLDPDSLLPLRSGDWAWECNRG
jgi:hypothetical protein